ncbi:cytochrome P450 [Ramaria rubella]|nr:cytochrome P450 [Ramaria rubella]
MTILSVSTTLVTVVCIFLAWLTKRKTPKRKVPLPPGPRRKWPFGNLFDMPVKDPWLVFTEWRKTHGDIISLQILGNTIIVLNTLETVNALLDKKGAIYSNRPEFILAGEIMGGNRTLPLLQYGLAWRNQRKLMHLALNSEVIKKYIRHQEDIALMYLRSLLVKPQDFLSNLRLASTQIVVSIAYGLSIKSHDDDYVATATAVLKFAEDAVVPGAYLVEFIPVLKHIPDMFGLIPFKTEGLKHRHLYLKMETMPFEHVKRNMATGSAQPSFSSDLLTRDDIKLDGDASLEDTIKVTAATMYAAGIDTTLHTVSMFIFAMALFPEKQKKAQDEIDQIVGSERFPNIDDRSSLPYVDALINEVLRWHPIAPMGVAHRTAQDDYYNGYFIPAGSLVIPNTWAISHEETIHESPDDFIPERFLQESGSRPLDPKVYTYGYGRRVCPGRFLADNSVYILITSILSAFRICKQLDAEGNEIPLPVVFTGLAVNNTASLLSHPEPYQCRFMVRSPTVLERIQSNGEEKTEDS